MDKDYIAFGYIAIMIFFWSYFATYVLFGFSFSSFLALSVFYGASFGLLLCLTYKILGWELDQKVIVYGSLFWFLPVTLLLVCLYGWLGKIKKEMIRT